MRPARLVLLVLAVVTLAACSGERGMLLSQWTLEADGVSRPLSLPAHFDRELGEHEGRYALRTTVSLPPAMRGRPLALTIPFFAALTSLRADGVDIPDSDTSPLERYRGSGPHRFLIPAQATQDGQVALELAVENRWSPSAWLDTVPRLTADLRGDPEYAFISSFDGGSAAAAMAMLMLVGFANGIVFLLDRRRGAYGWFTLGAFAGSAYPAFMLGLTQPVVGVYDPAVMGALVVTSSIGNVMFTARVFGRKASPFWWGLLLFWGIVATRAYGPFQSTRFLTPITVSSTVVAGVYSLWLLAMEMRRRRPPLANVLAVLGWPIVCVAAVGDFAAWLGFGELYHGVRAACLGTAVLAICQAAALGVQLMASLRHSDALNVELAGRVGALERTNNEVRTLNEELRRQIGSRSQQLAETLAKVGSLHLPVLRLEPGDVVEGRYRVVRFIGSGGMAWVYEVKRETDGRRLAMKLLHGRSSGAALSRFAREARLASEVDHPAIVAVLDVDITAEGVLFLVMEYVDGCSLEEYLDDVPPMSWSLLIMRQIAEGLEQVHARGIVHRDLKPANVLIEDSAEGPIAKIADFGVSLLLAEVTRVSRPDVEQSGDVRVTRAGRVMGSPMYMAPELAHDGAPVSAAIDMYAFGIMAHELLVGRPPFRDPLFVRAVHGRSLPPPPSLVVARPRLDRRVAELVDRCLSLDPARRPTAGEALQALAQARFEPDPTSVPSIRAV
jgi:serine/threonine-protein kinase